jgi:hypothetical protein
MTTSDIGPMCAPGELTKSALYSYPSLLWDIYGNPKRIHNKISDPTVHAQNVQLHNVQLQNLHLPNVQLQDVQVTKRPGYQTSILQNVLLQNV